MYYLFTGPMSDAHHARHFQEGIACSPDLNHLWSHLLLLNLVLSGALFRKPSKRTGLHIEWDYKYQDLYKRRNAVVHGDYKLSRTVG